MSIQKRASIRFVLAALSAFSLALPSRAFAEHVWAPRHERQGRLIEVANHYGYGMGVASDHTTWHLNEMLKPEQWLPREAIRIADYETWSRRGAAREFGQTVIGGAVTPHEGGPHLYLVSGERLTDTIDPGMGFFHGTEVRARDQWLGNDYWLPRIFLLWHAPVEALTQVGLEAERIVRERVGKGYNCGILMAKTLGKEGRYVPSSPFHGRWNELSELPEPRAEAAVRAVGRAGPDMVIQVVQTDDLRKIQANWHGHQIQTQF